MSAILYMYIMFAFAENKVGKNRVKKIQPQKKKSPPELQNSHRKIIKGGYFWVGKSEKSPRKKKSNFYPGRQVSYLYMLHLNCCASPISESG